MTVPRRTSRKTRYPGIFEVLGGRERRYMVSYRLPGAGQRTKTFATLGEARDFQAGLRDPVKARQQREVLRLARRTLADYFPEWLERRRNLRPSTRARYEDVARLYILPSLGGMSISAISRRDIELWVTAMEKQGASLHTIDKAYRTLRACLNGALDEHGLPNPARRVEIPTPVPKDRQFLTADQLDAVAQEVHPRYRALVFFLGYTGCRIGEATALRVKNLDLIRRRATIAENSPEVHGRKLPAGPTKTGRVRAVPFSEALAAELAVHLDAYGPRGPGGELDPEALVFTAIGGAPVRQGNFRVREFQAACLAVGVGRVEEGRFIPPRVHDLRHTAASLAAKAGFSMHEVKEMLGHSTIKMTSDLYMHLFDDDVTTKAERLGQLMRGAAETRGAVLELRRASS